MWIVFAKPGFRFFAQWRRRRVFHGSTLRLDDFAQARGRTPALVLALCCEARAGTRPTAWGDSRELVCSARRQFDSRLGIEIQVARRCQ